jgi:hypothetical protein
MVPSTLTTAVAPPMIRSRIQWIKGYEEKGPMKSHWTEYVTDNVISTQNRRTFWSHNKKDKMTSQMASEFAPVTNLFHLIIYTKSFCEIHTGLRIRTTEVGAPPVPILAPAAP